MGVQKPLKKATNLTFDKDLLDDAKALGINISQAAQMGLAAAVQKAKGDAWLAENRKAIEASNKWVEENGLPLASHRMFDV